MTRKEYKQMAMHWSVMDAGIRLTLPIQRRLETLEILGKERRSYGSTGIYQTLAKCLAFQSHKA